LEYHNGDVYEGDWESDQRNGTFTNRTTVIYHMYCKYRSSSCACLGVSGTPSMKCLIFLQNRKRHRWLLHLPLLPHFAFEGVGKFTSHVTGITYFGSWRDGLKHGPGTLTFPTGDELSGRWSEVTPYTVILNHTLSYYATHCQTAPHTVTLHHTLSHYTTHCHTALSCHALQWCSLSA
jgi:hypothetical protein